MGDNLIKQQTSVSNFLANKIMNNEIVIYVDETTFNLWQLSNKIWQSKDMKAVSIPLHRGKSVTCIGALDRFVGLRHYILHSGSNTSESFIEFLNGLAVSQQSQHATIVLDKLSIHHSKKGKEWQNKHSNIQF